MLFDCHCRIANASASIVVGEFQGQHALCQYVRLSLMINQTFLSCCNTFLVLLQTFSAASICHQLSCIAFGDDSSCLSNKSKVCVLFTTTHSPKTLPSQFFCLFSSIVSYSRLSCAVIAIIILHFAIGRRFPIDSVGSSLLCTRSSTSRHLHERPMAVRLDSCVCSILFFHTIFICLSSSFVCGNEKHSDPSAQLGENMSSLAHLMKAEEAEEKIDDDVDDRTETADDTSVAAARLSNDFEAVSTVLIIKCTIRTLKSIPIVTSRFHFMRQPSRSRQPSESLISPG